MTDDTGPDADRAATSGEEDRLHAFVDGELDDTACAEIARQLAADPALARRAAAYARDKQRLGEALARASGDSIDPYTAALTDGLARRLNRPRFRWLRHFAMAAALLAAGWWGHDLVRSVADPIPDQVADAAEIHELFAEDAEFPVELSAAESGALADWMRRQLGENVTVPNLSSIGLTFLGGRLLGREEGPFAQLVYEAEDGARVSLYLARPVEGDGGAIQVVEVGNLNAGYWQEDDLAYTIVTAAPDEQLLTIASRLGAAGSL